MVRLIQNMPSANDGEQHKDNDNSITQYFESNKNRILNLGEKNYENLVEAFTKNAIDTAANSSYNATLSLPQSSSSTFLDQSNQNATCKMKEPENYHNGKGDIAD